VKRIFRRKSLQVLDIENAFHHRYTATL
jgi:hypothetical protein